MPGTIVRHWQADEGYTGGAFSIDDINEVSIVVSRPTGVGRQLPKGDFRRVFALWNEYDHGKIAHHELTRRSENAAYIVSILHWCEEAQSSEARTLLTAAASLHLEPDA